MVATVADTRNRILDAAQRLIQVQGFSGFSYADVAADVGIRKASIHHHFAAKGDLALALMVRYRERFSGALEQIYQAHESAPARLDRYQQLFADVLRNDHRLCMCGMLAADISALPAAVRREVRGFFDDNEAWLTRVLTEGVKAKQCAIRGPVKTNARLLLSAFEGAMLVARARRELDHFTIVAAQAIANVVRS